MTIGERKLLRDLAIALALKTGALALLWALFVRGARPAIDARSLLPTVPPPSQGVAP